MADRIVPVAYVTKWALSCGIAIVRDGEVTESGALFKKRAPLSGLGDLYVPRGDWTEDKAEAEARYRSKIDAAREAAERKVKKLEALYSVPPKYTEG